MSVKVLLQGRVLTALTMLAIFLVMTLLSLGFPEKARLMPLLIGIPASVLALVQLILEYRTAAGEVLKAPDDSSIEEGRSESQMYLWLMLFFIGILCFGFVYAAPLLVFGFLYQAKKEPMKVALIGGVSTWLVLFGFFEEWIQIQLFNGLVLEWLVG